MNEGATDPFTLTKDQLNTLMTEANNLLEVAVALGGTCLCGGFGERIKQAFSMHGLKAGWM